MTESKTAPSIPSYKQRTMHHAALLGFMATITGAIVVVGNVETQGVIKQRYADDIKASLSQVIHPDMYNNNILNDTINIKYHNQDKKVYRARENGRVVAAAFQMTTIGYSGAIKIIMGIKASGELLGVRVLSHTETPGLGDKIDAKKSKWIYSFNNMSFTKLKPENWKVKKDKGFFDQFTGATITPRAVVKGIKEGMYFFSNHKPEILDLSQSDKPADTRTPSGHGATDGDDKGNPNKNSTEVTHHAGTI